MASSWRPYKSSWFKPSADPALGGVAPWPLPVVIGLALAGVVSPLIPFGGAVLAYAFADEEQGTLLIGAGLVYVILMLTFLSGG